MMKVTMKGLTVRSSKYMVFDKKSMPIVACKTITTLKHYQTIAENAGLCSQDKL